MRRQKDFAKPIVAAINALDSKTRRQILIELEDRSLSYSEILQKTGLDKGTLNYHLKKLVASGLVRNFLREGALHTSYYEVSTLGRRLIEGIFNAFRPPPSYIQIVASTTTALIRVPVESTYTGFIPPAEKGETTTQVIPLTTSQEKEGIFVYD